jgi:hypothetical protein
MLYPGFAAANSARFSMDRAIKQTLPEIGGDAQITALPQGGEIEIGKLHAQFGPLIILGADPPHFGTVDLAGNIGTGLWRNLILTLDLPHERMIVSKATGSP